MKKITAFVALSILSLSLFAQYPIVPIHDIQFVAGPNLGVGNDSSSYHGDTIQVEGIVTFDPCAYGLSSGPNRVGTWLQDTAGGAFGGVHVLIDPGVLDGYNGTPDDLDNDVDFIDNFQEGFQVRATGIVTDFGGNTQVALLPVQSSPLGAVGLPSAHIISIDSFMQSDGVGGQDQQMISGERWEGSYVEFQGVTLIDVSINGGRVSWSLQDGAGNKIRIRDVSGHIRNDDQDRFCIQPNYTPYTFSLPTIGSFFTHVRGILVEFSNPTGEYLLAPRDTTDIGPVTFAPPVVSNITRNPVVASSSQTVDVSADIIDYDGSVVSASLHWSIGIGNTSFSSVAMSLVSGNNYSGTVPATSADSVYVNFYIEAIDDEGHPTYYPDSMATNSFYLVLDNGITTIRHLQNDPLGGGVSVWNGDSIPVMNVQGVVTASEQSYDLGFVCIQDGNSPFSGIVLKGTQTDALVRGDMVQVTSGRVRENFNVTEVQEAQVTVLSQGNAIPTKITTINPDSANTGVYDHTEMYESMFVGFDNAEVISQNPDAPSNFGEWQINTVSGAAAGLRCDNYSNDIPFSFNDDSLSVGQNLAFINGIMYYSFGNWKLLPRNLDDIANFGTNYPKDIVDFDFNGLAPPIAGTVNQANKTVTLLVPAGTDVTNLVPTISISGESVSPASGVAQDFTNPVTFTVTAPIDASTQDYTVTVNVVSGIATHPLANLISVFPNPATDLVTVEIDPSLEKTKVAIYDIRGERFDWVSLRKKTAAHFDVSDYAPGVYFITITARQGKIAKKIEVVR